MASAFSGCWALKAQQPDFELTAQKCFVDAPDTVIGMVDKNARLDMVDYYDAHSTKGTKNIFGGECQIVSNDMAADASALKFTSSTDMEYIVFVLNSTSAEPVIGLVETIPTPMRDSSVKFYTRLWEAPAKSPWKEPGLADWLVSKADREEVALAMPFIMYSAQVDPQSKELILTQEMAPYFAPDDAAGQQALSKIKPRLVYRWDGKQFKLVSK